MTGYMVPNGRPSSSRHDAKARSTSSTIHDRSKNGPDFGSMSAHGGRNGVAGGSSASSMSSSRALQAPGAGGAASSSQMQPGYGPPYGGGPASTAKESFLNYFFGGADHASAAGSHAGVRSLADGSGRAGVGGSALDGRMAGSLGDRADNPLSGRKGLEGNAAAFDMKSLDKHLEAVSCRG